ncbi:MAG TPA: hypothetical protein VFD39_05680, partial [Trueperaceae bacterium]|nr:hypothetical protein [Trueperaceae bacterium]
MEVSESTLERLSFDRVKLALAERTATYMGAERAGELGPRNGVEAALAMHERVAETVDGGDLGLGGIEDVRPLLARAREGAGIDGRDILAVAYTLDAGAFASARQQRPHILDPAESEVAAVDGLGNALVHR